MSQRVIVIGGRPNGLVAACVLGKAGLKPLVLERLPSLGGCAATSRLAPGFHCQTLSHRAAIDPSVARSLELARHGLDMVSPAALVSSAMPDGRMLTLWADAGRAAREIAAFSAHDAERYPRFLTSFSRVSAVLQAVMAANPLSIDQISAPDLVMLVGAARKLRRLDRADARRLLRWMPMPVADLVSEWFESESLRTLVAAEGLLGAFLGPRSPGSSLQLLLLGAREGHPISTGRMPRGGMAALVTALTRAAREAGAEIRVDAEVREIRVQDGRATGVVLATGEEVTARVVLSSADPRRTFGLVDPAHLAPDFIRRVRGIRMRGTLAKVNYAVSSLPRFAGLDRADEGDQRARLSGGVRLCSGMTALERAFDRAKYGELPTDPWIELMVPSITDPDLAPEGQHVVSAYVQFAPFTLRKTSWDHERDQLGDVTTRTIATYAPQFPSTVVAREVVTPLDLERTYGLTGGQIFHGELALDQIFLARPFLGWARYSAPIRHLFLCGSGVHPGTGLDGRSGALAARAVVKSGLC